MRAFILCDYEGTTGTVSWEEEATMGPEAMEGDVNAIIRGLREGGFTKFVVRDYHAHGRTIRPHELDPAATLIRGKRTPFPYGLSPSLDAMVFAGAHAMAGTQTGVMSHTMNGDVYDVRINDTPIGEVGGYALLAGHYGVPIILVTGDEAACEEARAIIPAVETAVVKVGLSRLCATCLHPVMARTLIESKARDAARRAGSIEPAKWDGPFTLEVTFKSPENADRAAETLGADRTAGRTVTLRRETVAEVLQCFERGFE